MDLIDFAMAIANIFLSSSNERVLINNLYRNLNNSKIILPNFHEPIPIIMTIIDGKLFYDTRLRNINLRIVREVADIIFIVKTNRKIGFSFVQLKHTRKDITSEHGEKFLGTRSARGMNKGQLFLYSGFLEALNSKKGLFNVPDGYYLYHTYWASGKHGPDEYVLLIPSRHLFFDMHIQYHDASCPIYLIPSIFNWYIFKPSYCISYLSCCLGNNSYKLVAKILDNMIFCSRCINWLKKFSGNLYLTTRTDIGDILFFHAPSTDLLFNCACNSTTLLYRWLGGVLTNQYTVSKSKLKDEAVLSDGTKSYQVQLGEILFKLFLSAYRKKFFCKTGYKHSCKLIDPPR